LNEINQLKTDLNLAKEQDKTVNDIDDFFSCLRKLTNKCFNIYFFKNKKIELSEKLNSLMSDFELAEKNHQSQILEMNSNFQKETENYKY
jgi:hypothetical protein